MSYTAVGLVYLYVHTQECGMKAGPLRRCLRRNGTCHRDCHGRMGGGHQQPSAMRPPRWTSQMVNATEATTARLQSPSSRRGYLAVDRSTVYRTDGPASPANGCPLGSN